MNRHNQDELLREILAGEELAEFRRASLERGLATLRRRNQWRRAAPIGAVAALALLGAVGIGLQQRTETPEVSQLASLSSRPSAGKTAATEPVKSISDEELLALFPDHSAALVGPPGQQVFLVFDDVNDDAQLQ